jgi:hypothetical protein
VRRAARAAFYLAICIAACALVIGLSGCATSAHGPRPDPTPDAPWIGCIAKSPFPAMQKHTPGGSRLLPEIVRIIGLTPIEDGERLMVIRGVYTPAKCRGDLLWNRTSCDWQPFAREEVQTRGCGPEASAYDRMQPEVIP